MTAHPFSHMIQMFNLQHYSSLVDAQQSGAVYRSDVQETDAEMGLRGSVAATVLDGIKATLKMLGQDEGHFRFMLVARYQDGSEKIVDVM